MDLLQKKPQKTQQHKTEKVQVKTEEGSGDWHKKTSTEGECGFKRAASATN